MLEAMIISEYFSGLVEQEHFHDRVCHHLDGIRATCKTFEELTIEDIGTLKDYDIFIIDMNVQKVSRYFYETFLINSSNIEQIVNKTLLGSKERTFVILDSQTKNFSVPGIHLRPQEISFCNNKNLIKTFIPINWESSNNVTPLISIKRTNTPYGFVDQLIFSKEYPQLSRMLARLYSNEFNYYHPFYQKSDIVDGAPRSLSVGEDIQYSVAVAYNFNSPGKVIIIPNISINVIIENEEDRQYAEKRAYDYANQILRIGKVRHDCNIPVQQSLVPIDIKKGDFIHKIQIMADNTLFIDGKKTFWVEETHDIGREYWPDEYMTLLRHLLSKQKRRAATEALIWDALRNEGRKRYKKDEIPNKPIDIKKSEYRMLAKMIREIREAFNTALKIPMIGERILPGNKKQGYRLITERI